MNERSNLVTASLERGKTTVTTHRLWQYDYGMKLRLENIDLPDRYEVHFSNGTSGDAVIAIGNAEGVGIPDQVLTTGESVHAWLYLHTGEDDGETVYHIIIPVFPRAAPGDGTPTPAEQSAVTQAIALLRTGISRAEEAAEDAEAASQAIQDLSVEARTLTAGSQASAVKNVGQDGSVTISFGIPQGEQGDPGNLSRAELEAALAAKAEIDGTYAGMTAGKACNLAVIGKSGEAVPMMTEDKAPYLFRPAGGSADIGNRAYDTLVGGTVTWNQLVDTGTTEVTIQSGRKYVACIGGIWSCAQSAGTALSVTGGTDMVFDLTQMFGTAIANYVYGLEQATAGAGIAWLRSYGFFLKDSYAYDAGSLQSVQVSSHETVGFNAYGHSTGTAKLLGGHQYQITGAYTALAYEDINGDTEAITPDSNGLFTPMHDGILTVSGGNNTTTCVHLVWSGYRNGEYEAYSKRSYPLDSALTLNGVFKLDSDYNLYCDGDTYVSDGTVMRNYGIVDLGTITPSLSSNITNGWVFSISSMTQWSSNTSKIPDGIIPGYTAIQGKASAFTGGKEWTWRLSTTSRGVVIADPDFEGKTSEEVQAMMSGVYLVYKKRSKDVNTETADPFQSPQIVDDFGTEEYTDAGVIAETRDVAIPVGHVTRYPANLRDKLQHLPDLASADGRYVIQQSSQQMVLVADTSPGRLTALEGGKQQIIVSASITLSAAWTGSGPYTQTVTVTGATATANSKVDLQLTAAQIAALQTAGVTALVIENNVGTLTAYALGAAPSSSMTVQCTVTEVEA